MINKKKLIMNISKLLYRRSLPEEIQKCNLSYTNNHSKPPWKILFFGTDNFSLFSLKSLLKEYREGGIVSKLDVCTSTKKVKNDIHKFAERENLRIWPWPPDLNKTDFDAGVVVSFGRLIPRKIIEKFPLGMINVHASLLPRWRGAAPIIYCLSNGDRETGVSIMQIEPLKFDVGKIISQKTFKIPDDMYMPELSSKLGSLGSSELIECLKDLTNKLAEAKPQSEDGVSYAPKVDTSFSVINWKDMTSIQIFNLQRALLSFLPLTTIWKGETIKLFNIQKCEDSCKDEIVPGYLYYDDTLKVLKATCSDQKYVTIEQVQIFQKKIISAKDFYNGYLRKTSMKERYFG